MYIKKIIILLEDYNDNDSKAVIKRDKSLI